MVRQWICFKNLARVAQTIDGLLLMYIQRVFIESICKENPMYPCKLLCNTSLTSLSLIFSRQMPEWHLQLIEYGTWRICIENFIYPSKIHRNTSLSLIFSHQLTEWLIQLMESGSKIFLLRDGSLVIQLFFV